HHHDRYDGAYHAHLLSWGCREPITARTRRRARPDDQRYARLVRYFSSMWIVRLALRRPYTFVVASLLILIFGIVTLRRTPTDIFPTINIPVVSVVWQYTGTAPIDMERRMVSVFERAATTTVNNIE